MPAKKKMNALDAAIMGKKKLPSKNKRYPGDSDVTTTPSKGRPIIRPNAKPAPLAKAPAKPKGALTPAPMPKGPKNKGVAKRPVKPGKKK